ncbi:hypothetical protein [Aquincola sp. J276]|uniref:hypothetical protein n=1 Tax=Aquincola sp. J276 TaxID=2898432 RepID=UPI002151D33A|nr:hypothetical protein [Aquincola sp. J276]MCR5868044.1 hypothetical protein [Aquincola sp. J276]
MPQLHPHSLPRRPRRARAWRSAADLRRLATPWFFYALAGRLVRWLAAVAVLGGLAALMAARAAGAEGAARAAGAEGTIAALLHAVTAPLAGGLYLLMALAAGLGLLGVARLCPIVAAAAAPTTALMAMLSMAAQAVQASAGDAWWNAQLAPEAMLLPFTLGAVLLRHAIAEPARADRAAAVLLLAGLLPLAVLHLGAMPAPPAAPPPAAALALGLLAGGAHAAAVVLQRTRLEIVERARRQLHALEVL